MSALGVALPLLNVPRKAFARTAGTRALDFVHTHTGERLFGHTVCHAPDRRDSCRRTLMIC